VTRYASIPSGAVVADLCAAPGGKAIELSRTAAAVIASDRIFARMDRVVANRRRLDVENLLPIVADAKAPAIRPVDAVLLDVPCTGTGTFRRHPDARWRLKVSDIAVMASTQRTILRCASSVVKPGGLLIYSTCSLEPEENESQIEIFLALNPNWKLEPPEADAVPPEVVDGGYLRVLPQMRGTDGAFAARLRRVA
jgi:16S rRNA (cytosine967-C5)-methyltransferase